MLLGDRAKVPSAAENGASPERLKAEGFPVAPIIEAIMEVQFAGGLNASEVDAVRDALAKFYPDRAETRQTGFVYDIATEAFDLQDARSVFRLSGNDGTEVAIVGPAGFSASQLTPYKSWEVLFERFARDWESVDTVLACRLASRLAVRYVNRIDVPMDEHGTAEYEQYIASHIQLPRSIPTIHDFYLRFALQLPEIGALATVQSAVMPQAVEGKASFALDIDVAKTEGLATDRAGLLKQLSSFRASKNNLYRQLLTDKALGEFR
ncbi:TIGR04255 family protein [Sphingomonas sp. HITSZ_GF]|uniref:TIGR04255 family protein n=1 Tax=Sphingomonas sp. HITSZ_GF TaxID=3037247 RepID=UPI00240D3F2D|nr:TIGR04255 family protein [Sphingomonas sp. HITSZ_GF]MDG2533773.1 TIGR04255 family protein [Sphingomonas sp. HITSZ_GF]